METQQSGDRTRPGGYRLLLWMGLILGVCGLSGCSWLGRDKLQQVQADNERLISDYRTERDRAEALAARNRELAARLSELEGQLQRMAAGATESPYQPASRSTGGWPAPSGGPESPGIPAGDGIGVPQSGAAEGSAAAGATAEAPPTAWRPGG